jgi:hypothetical protein
MLNSSKVLIIIPCGKSKIWAKNPNAGPVRAKDAYTSNYFKLCRLYAERFSDRWLIISGKYGVISPDFLLKTNYNKKLNISKTFRIKVSKQIAPTISKGFKKIVSLCGQEYSPFLQDVFTSWGLEIYRPLQGLRIGVRQKTLKKCLIRNRPL